MENVIHLVCLPKIIAESVEFKCLTQASRERLALYCFAMLEADCRPKANVGKRKWRGVSQRKLERYIRRASIRSTREILVQMGWIEVNGKFSFRIPDAKKSLGHRFADKVREGEFVRYELKFNFQGASGDLAQ